MTWSYDVDTLNDGTDESRKNEVRFLVGDTDETIPMVQDEEIEMTLLRYPPADSLKPAWLAAAHVCDAIAGKFARKMQQTLGPLSASNQQQYEHYVALASHLRLLYSTNGKASQGMGSVTVAAPILSGGGPTYLGGSSYSNSGDGTGV